MIDAPESDPPGENEPDEIKEVKDEDPVEPKNEEPDQPQQNHIHFGEAHLATKEDVAAGVERGNISLAGEEAETLALPQVSGRC